MSCLQGHHRIPFLRRLYDQRDQARSERDAAIAELSRRDAAIAGVDRLKAERDAAIADRDHMRKLFIEVSRGEVSRGDLPAAPFGITLEPGPIDDSELVRRIIAAYRACTMKPAEPSGSFWDGIFAEQKHDVHEALILGDVGVVQRLLRDPGKTDLFYGFDYLAVSVKTEEAQIEAIRIKIYQDLLLLAEVVGARRLWNPEDARPIPPLPQVEELLGLIDQGLGLPTVFPNPFPGELGLATSRGVISYRAIQALYQAWRIFALVNMDREARVCEIGAGLGRTALYAWRFGLHNYTIVDLPMSCVAQAYFLGRTLGDDAVRLFGEEGPGISILPPSAFLEAKETYDLVLNVDSLTELDARTAKAYCEAIRDRAGVFPSRQQAAPAGPTLGQRGSLPHTGPASRCDPPRCLAGSGAPPPEENPTERKYNFLLQAAITWPSLLAAYLRQSTHRLARSGLSTVTEP